MTSPYEKIADRLQKEQYKIYDKIPEKYHDLLRRALSIEYKLSLYNEGHDCELDDEATPTEADKIYKLNQ